MPGSSNSRLQVRSDLQGPNKMPSHHSRIPLGTTLGESGKGKSARRQKVKKSARFVLAVLRASCDNFSLTAFILTYFVGQHGEQHQSILESAF